ncbi:Uncharacterised protein [Campylobacter hyointestinalis]|uniref:Uncharacterized protein n=2 Tax=Campylobacter hyointestinalis TaxID=198 RepID=A0A9W5AV34_CAMHY|nr:hypothetical protein [Campylobacter hyointestinalis]PPB65813.1 hypothetical protein CDQ75_07500 [Campylobacter hyointestinalis subsp. hyointestinalis]PPB66988.1 hypothetical protein CDQ76_07430 [Campylobacter hyointestinalis subsp. hyointestinalis]TWO20003.1 hypothetical protein YZ80_06255 [Campylobacter hyointestinalis]CUU86348.1 Uncharacterised protein [Campylobacter hyointestinalis subsp. hyointestinalis]CUU87424.1 Uncharacterised protein [Campylobacter hyointestinalis subsp. hyointestin
MVLYNRGFELIGMSRETLNLFGFNDIDTFFKNHKDISDFFVQKSIFYNQNVHFIDLIVNHPEFNLQNIALKLDSTEVININIDVDIILLKDNDDYLYQVSITKDGMKCDLPIRALPELRLPDIGIAKDGSKTLDLEHNDKYKLSKEWLIKLSHLVSPSMDKFEKDVLSFLEYAKICYDKLCDAVLLEDETTVHEITRSLFPLCEALKFDEFTRTLKQLEISIHNQNSSFSLDKYNFFITQLENIMKEGLHEKDI